MYGKWTLRYGQARAVRQRDRGGIINGEGKVYEVYRLNSIGTRKFDEPRVPRIEGIISI